MNGKHSAGKGSKYRPVDQNRYNENWEQAFRKNKKKKTNKRKNKK